MHCNEQNFGFLRAVGVARLNGATAARPASQQRPSVQCIRQTNGHTHSEACWTCQRCHEGCLHNTMDVCSTTLWMTALSASRQEHPNVTHNLALHKRTQHPNTVAGAVTWGQGSVWGVMARPYWQLPLSPTAKVRLQQIQLTTAHNRMPHGLFASTVPSWRGNQGFDTCWGLVRWWTQEGGQDSTDAGVQGG